MRPQVGLGGRGGLLLSAGLGATLSGFLRSCESSWDLGVQLTPPWLSAPFSKVPVSQILGSMPLFMSEMSASTDGEWEEAMMMWFRYVRGEITEPQDVS